MACYLAPEKPCLSSSISEAYFQRIHFYSALPSILPDRRHSRFGTDYEKELCFHLGQHAEINPDHRLCLIGEEDQWASIVQEKLFLNKKIDFLHCQSDRDGMKQSLPPSTYDGIILFQCLEQVYRHSLSFIHLCRRALKDDGQLIIIHRDVNSQTLPLPSEVFPPWSNKSSHLLRKLLEHLQRHQRHSIDFFQETRSIKFTMRKIHWFSLLYHRTFYPLTLIEQNKIVDGLRRLNETFFKYHSGPVEMFDRLVFLSIPNRSESFDRLPRYLRSMSVYPRPSMNNAEVFEELARLNQPIIKPNLFASTLRLL